MPTRIGFVVRYKEDLLPPGLTTVDEHNKIQHSRGKVWLAKFGLPINPSSIRLCGQPAIHATLILVRTKKGPKDTGTRLYFAQISAAKNNPPPPALVPPYYRRHRSAIDTWFCLITELAPMPAREARLWIIASSRQPLPDAIRNCPRTSFLVTRKSDLPKVQSLLAQLAPPRAAAPGARAPILSRPGRPPLASAFEDDLGHPDADPADSFLDT